VKVRCSWYIGHFQISNRVDTLILNQGCSRRGASGALILSDKAGARKDRSSPRAQNDQKRTKRRGAPTESGQAPDADRFPFGSAQGRLHDNAETGKRRPEGFGMLRYRAAALQRQR